MATITELLPQVEEYITDWRGREALDELRKLVGRYDPDYCAKQLIEALSEPEPSSDYLGHLINDLESATARYFVPVPAQYAAYKRDLKVFFGLLHRYLEMDRLDGVADVMSYYHRIFKPGGKAACGSVLYACRCKDRGDYESVRFKTSDDVVCSECHGTRSLCNQAPSTNGRCKYHGGENVSRKLNGSLAGRAALYAESLQGALQRSYIEAISDENFLSVAPEIAALSARVSDLMRNIGDTDYVAISANVRQAIRKMDRAISEERTFDVVEIAHEIETIMNTVGDEQRRWDEIGVISARLTKLAETERKRIIDAQQMVSVQEMYQLQQETLLHIRDSTTIIAQEIHRRMLSGEDLDAARLRRMMLEVLHRVISGSMTIDSYLEKREREALPEIIEDGEIVNEDS